MGRVGRRGGHIDQLIPSNKTRTCLCSLRVVVDGVALWCGIIVALITDCWLFAEERSWWWAFACLFYEGAFRGRRKEGLGWVVEDRGGVRRVSKA